MANKKISELNSVSLPLVGTEEIPIVQSGETKKIAVDNLRPYKVYTALLTQSGANAPVATVLENTLCETISFSYVSSGYFTINTTGEFPVNKTFFSINCVINSAVTSSESYIAILSDTLNVNTIDFITLDDTNTQINDILLNTPIEIRVYN